MLAVLTLIMTVVMFYFYLQTDAGLTFYFRAKRSHDVLNYMDLTEDPCDNFYKYACGHWSKFNPIPDDEIKNTEFQRLQSQLLEEIREMLEVDNNDSDWDAHKKAKMFYKSCMNTEVLKQKGLTRLLALFNSYGGWPVLLDKNWNETAFDWLDLLEKVEADYDMKILFSVYVSDNMTNNDQNQIYVLESSSILPNKNFYEAADKKYYLNAYKKYMEEVLIKFGVKSDLAKNTVSEIIEFDKQVAAKTIDKDKRIDLSEILLTTTIEELHLQYPEIDWALYISKCLGHHVNRTQLITIVNEPFFPNLFYLVKVTPKRTVANYMMWRVAKNLLSYVDDRFDKAIKKFGITAYGQPENSPRWKVCVEKTKTNFPEPVGSLYIKTYFQSENDQKDAKEVEMIANHIRHALIVSINRTDWIDFATRDIMVRKVKNMKSIIGYADYLLSKLRINREYIDVEVHPERYLNNYLHIRKLNNEKQKRKMREKVDKSETFLDPMEANAIYESLRNRINIPAGILKYPFFNRHLPKAINFAQIGSIIGHEMVHGFDDKGRQFNEVGNLIDWWQPRSVANFKTRAQCIVRQYSKFEYGDARLRSVASQGEDIADNGGIRQAYYAYKDWLRENPDPEILENESIPGFDFTNLQLFFISYAQNWCSTVRPESLKHIISVDPHTPEKFRVIGPLANFEKFAKVFNCPIRSRLNPISKCRVW